MGCLIDPPRPTSTSQGGTSMTDPKKRLSNAS